MNRLRNSMSSVGHDVPSLSKLSRDLVGGNTSPTELLEKTLENIRRINPKINAFITLLAEQALTEATKVENEIKRGLYKGPLHGIPVSIKDIIYIQSVKCTAGSKILVNNVASYDATVVAKLKEGGAIIVGTNNLHEFALGVTSINPHYGPVRNPWNTSYIAGGSSGGSAAAVASNLTPISIGTDTGGSVRIPASLCGVVGLKPTYGRISKHGVIPLSWSLDHVGILARNVEDAAIVLKSIAGYDPKDETTVYAEVHDYTSILERNIEGLKICIMKNMVPVHREVSKIFEKFISVLEGLGVVVDEKEFECADRVRPCWTTIILGEAAAFHDKWYRERKNDYGEDVRSMIEKGRQYTAIDYIKAKRMQIEIKNNILRLLDDYHAIISPTTPVNAVEIGKAEVEINGERTDIYTALTNNTILYNITGLPCVSIPAGLSSLGLPIGVQIAGRLFDESTILRIAHQAMKELWTVEPPSL